MSSSEDSLLEKNLLPLSRRSPALAEAIRDSAEPEDLIFLPAKRASGEPAETALYQGRALHSRFDPLREARRLIEHSGVPKEGCLIFLGFGLGYPIEEYRRQRPGAPVIAAEPDTALLRAVLSRRDFSQLLGDPEFHLYGGPQPEGIIPLLERYYGRPFHLLKLRSAADLNPDYHRRMEKRINTYLSRKEVNHNTLRRFGSLWMRNLTRNIPRFAGAPGIRKLENSLAGVPALILAAGPSLDRLRGRLTELSQRMVIIAVDTACRFCREEGIDPDFAVVVDPQYWNSRHLDYCRLEKTILVTESSVFPGVLERNFAAAYFGQSLFPLGRALESVLEDRGRLGAGGSVTTSAWDFARYLGAEPLYMAGLDLGYPHHQTHCRGSFFEERAHWMARRTLPAETASFDYLYQARPYPIPAAGGGTTLSDNRLQVYQWWFEDRMAENPEGKTYTLSPRGSALEGMPLASLESLSDLPLLSRERREQLAAFRSPGYTEERRRALQHQADDVLDAMDTLEETAGRAAELAKELKTAAGGSGEGNSIRLQAGFDQLSQMDQAMMRISFREIAEFLLQPFLYEMLQSRGNDAREILEQSEQLYRRIRETAAFHAGLLRRARRLEHPPS